MVAFETLECPRTYARSAACHMTFFGTQPTLTQVPPSRQVSSTMATCRVTLSVQDFFGTRGGSPEQRKTRWAYLGAVLGRPASGTESTATASDDDQVIVVVAFLGRFGLERNGSHRARRDGEGAGEVGQGGALTRGDRATGRAERERRERGVASRDALESGQGGSSGGRSC